MKDFMGLNVGSGRPVGGLLNIACSRYLPS